MKREIKFRGKSKKTGEWVFGYYYSECGNHYIIEDRQQESELNRNVPHEIDPDTLSRYFGDQNGEEIYEGDIVQNDDDDLLQVVHNKYGFAMRLLNDYRYEGYSMWWYNVKIIGNIYENPELLNPIKTKAMKKVTIITGPQGSGKTTKSIELSKQFKSNEVFRIDVSSNFSFLELEKLQNDILKSNPKLIIYEFLSNDFKLFLMLLGYSLLMDNTFVIFEIQECNFNLKDFKTVEIIECNYKP